MMKEVNFTLLRTTTPTRASVTEANAVSNKKYVLVYKPVPKYCGVIDHHIDISNCCGFLENKSNNNDPL